MFLWPSLFFALWWSIIFCLKILVLENWWVSREHWRFFVFKNYVKFVLFEVQLHIWYQNNQKLVYLSWNSLSVWYTWYTFYHDRICTTLFWTLKRSVHWWRALFRCRIDLLNFSMGFNIVAPFMVCVTHKWVSPSLSFPTTLINWLLIRTIKDQHLAFFIQACFMFFILRITEWIRWWGFQLSAVSRMLSVWFNW